MIKVRKKAIVQTDLPTQSETLTSIVRKIWTLLTPTEKRSGVILLVLMFVGMLLETLGIGIIIPALSLITQDDIATKYPMLRPLLQSLGNPSQQSIITAGMLVLVGVYLIKNLFLAYLIWYQTSFAFGVKAELSQKLFFTYLQQPYTFHLQRNSAQLVRNAISEVNIFVSSGVTAGMQLIAESLVILGLCTLLLIVEPLGALIVVIVLSTAAWAFYHVTRRHVSRWGEARQYHEGLRIQHIQQGLGGAKDIKLLGRENDFQDQYKIHNAESARVGQLQTTLQKLPRLWLEFLAVTGLATLVVVMLAKGAELSAIMPMLALFAASAFRLMPSVNRILKSIQSLRYSLPVINTLHEELKLTIPNHNSEDLVVKPFQEAIHLDNVRFTYPGTSESTLDGLSLSIQHGESVGFFGDSGAGKSTLVDIILGLLKPDTGCVKVDGEDIQKNLRNWQNQVGYVPQTIYLTDDTLRRNVAFGLPNSQIDDVAIQNAIHAAQLEDFVAGLPEGLETVVGERGIRLSGGQRQRIGIARALYHNPSILVLDEATSALDVTTEGSVMQAVNILRGEKTILMVAHRLSTMVNCDRLFRLQNGTVAEEGTPQSMMLSK